MLSNTIVMNERAGVLKLSGQITEELALEFREKLDLLIAYYQHERVTLQLNSDGGHIGSLQHMLDAIDRYREAGVKFITHAPFRACSAAAVLLATGEPGMRQVSRQTNLLFHHARQQVQGNQALTADMALRLAGMLSELDTVFELAIASHLNNSFGGIVNLAAEGLARCALLESRGNTSGMLHETLQTSRLSTETDAIHRMWTACIELGDSEPYLSYLSNRFSKDSWMALPEAYALVLIDAIDRVPSLLALANQPACQRTLARLCT
jgi:ATP-dependent protease ClpP protease subunit